MITTKRNLGPITQAMVTKAYHRVKQNKGSGGIDGMSWAGLEKDLDRQLYQLWNRLSSGSYFPPPVKEVEIPKKDGGVRKLGIPTLLDRIAQEVVRTHWEPKVDGRFHDSSYGYRRHRSCHGAVDKTLFNILPTTGSLTWTFRASLIASIMNCY